jgi:ribosomal protein S18 acetylase RimI-like enzyme
MSEPATLAYTIRHPVEAEIDAVVDLMNACSVDDIGSPDTEPGDLLRWWRRPDFDLSRDAWVAEAGDGRIVGWIDVALEAPEGDTLLDGYTHPEFAGRGIGSHLADLAEARAVEMAVEGGRSMPVEVFHGAWAGTMPARFMAQRGYDLTRCFIRMRIDMDAPPSAPVWPEGIRVEGFERGRDERLYHESLEDAFVDHWRWSRTPHDEWVRAHVLDDPNFDGSLWFRAMDGEEVAGMIIGRPRTSEDPNAAWISALGVRGAWRRRGIGLALLLHELGEFYRRGIRAAALGVDAESPTGATGLYEVAGMREVRRADIFMKTFG